MEIEQVDEGDGEKKKIRERPDQPVEARFELQPGQQVERPDTERQKECLDDEQRLRTR